MTITRPYISFTFQYLSQFMHSPRKSHLNVTFHVLRYLKQNPCINIVKNENIYLSAYVDAN